MCEVVNKYRDDYDVYIGRGSIWGNPFPITVTDNREDVIHMYRQHLYAQIKSGAISIDQLKSLNGKILGCFCKPKACHGDVIVKAVNWAMKNNEKSS